MTQDELNESVRGRIRDLLDRDLPIQVTPPNPKVSRLLSYQYYETLMFGCLSCGNLLSDAFAFCSECSAGPVGPFLVDLILDGAVEASNG